MPLWTNLEAGQYSQATNSSLDTWFIKLLAGVHQYDIMYYNMVLLIQAKETEENELQSRDGV